MCPLYLCEIEVLLESQNHVSIDVDLLLCINLLWTNVPARSRTLPRKLQSLIKWGGKLYIRVHKATDDLKTTPGYQLHLVAHLLGVCLSTVYCSHTVLQYSPGQTGIKQSNTGEHPRVLQGEPESQIDKVKILKQGFQTYRDPVGSGWRSMQNLRSLIE